MRREVHVIATISFLSVVALTGFTPPPPGRWEKVDALAPGTEIIVLSVTGQRLTCTLVASSPDELRVTAPPKGERSIRKADVLKVLRENPNDSVLNGVLWGALIGAGAGAAWGSDRPGEGCGNSPCGLYIGATLGAPVGALVGYLRDKRLKAVEVLYRSER